MWRNLDKRELKIASKFFDEALSSLRFEEEEGVTQVDAPWITRLLLLAITFPRDETGQTFLADCQVAWKKYVVEDRIGPGVRHKLCRDVGGSNWHQKIKEAFVNYLCPYLLSLDNNTYQHLRKVRNAHLDVQQEPFLALSVAAKLLSKHKGQKEKESLLLAALPSISLLLWAWPDRDLPEYFYLRETGIIGGQMQQFVKQHLGVYLTTIKHDLRCKEFKTLVKIVKGTPPSAWGKLALMSDRAQKKEELRKIQLQLEVEREQRRKDQAETARI